jgi:hypothetical protein
VPADRSIVLGSVQLIQPSPDFPELRLRFSAPRGHVYGPLDVVRIAEDIGGRPIAVSFLPTSPG